MKQNIGDYYSILGVSRTANLTEIKLAFHRKARECHPDVSNRSDANEMFSLLNKAYSVLRDKKKRTAYNHELMAEIFQKQVVDPAKSRFTRFGYSSDISDDEWGWRVG